ncbi:MAG: polysaccharide deacetylase family protein [Lachnospiraceae bacterium]|nr:polysaccharide deacetylase family protein [Lachnospiraceae bacterium]
MKTYICFPEGKAKVLTMSYDDGRLADKRLVSIFNQYGIRGTFNLNSGLMSEPDRISKEEIREVYQGHEIATHTYTHPTIARCPATEIYREIVEDRKELEAITGCPVRGHAYPNGSVSDQVKRIFSDCGIAYGRTVEETGGFELPTEWMNWKATCHHNHALLKLGESFLNFKKTQYLKCMYVWGHSFEFDSAGNWELIEEFCKMMGGQPESWYATNIENHDYMEAWNLLQFAADESFVYNPTAMDLWFSVDGEIVKVPGGDLVILCQ